MTIANRMQLLLAILITALVVVGAAGLVQMSRINGMVVYQGENILPSIETLALADHQVLNFRGLVLLHVLATDAEAMGKVEARLAETRSAAEQALKAYEPLISNDEDRRLLEADRAALKAYLESADRALALSRDNRNEEAQAQVLGDGATRARELIETLRRHMDFNEKMASDFEKEAESSYQSSFMMTVGLVLAAAIGGGVFGMLTYRRVVGSLKSMNEVIQQIASSLDFTRRVTVQGSDEVADTGRAFNQLIERVQQSLHAMADHAGKVSSAGTSLATSAQQVSIGSSEQSEAASAMAAAVEEMTVSINHVAERAADANKLATRAGEDAHNGAEVIGLTLADIRRIDEAVRKAADRVRQLDADSAKVNAVVTVIKEVADQTNLLALNAAIEAARAGEQGRGFAVVADEVRKLAERTAQSTQEISSTMEAMQSGARNAVSGMDQAVEQVERGVVHAQQAEESIRQIEDGSARTVEMVAEISDAIREQSVASSNIAQQVERVAQMTDENSAAAGSTSDTAHVLTGLAREMQAEVSRYRV
ncbi:MAG: methyl-accepting chemotaxis protein [Parazoarcus communis]